MPPWCHINPQQFLPALIKLELSRDASISFSKSPTPFSSFFPARVVTGCLGLTQMMMLYKSPIVSPSSYPARVVTGCLRLIQMMMSYKSPTVSPSSYPARVVTGCVRLFQMVMSYKSLTVFTSYPSRVVTGCVWLFQMVMSYKSPKIFPSSYPPRVAMWRHHLRVYHFSIMQISNSNQARVVLGSSDITSLISAGFIT
jgi:hypothetical protein